MCMFFMVWVVVLCYDLEMWIPLSWEMNIYGILAGCLYCPYKRCGFLFKLFQVFFGDCLNLF
jgi:hypothetical protein